MYNGVIDRLEEAGYVRRIDDLKDRRLTRNNTILQREE